VIVEKILARSERIPHSWAIDGTTGYEFADAAIAVLTDASGCSLIADQSARGSYDFEREATSARREAMEELFPGQVERLADEVARLARDELGRAEIPVGAFRNAIVALTECLSVYRIYTTPLNRIDADSEIVDSATALAQGRLSDKLSVDALWVLHTVVLGLEPDLDSRSRSRAWKQACIHWQQLSSPVAAKGIEDTALYRFPGVLSAADVGSNPAEPALTVSQFHESMLRRHTSGLAGLNATSTHDSKRSEDARTRLAVLSQIPDRWIELVVALRTVTGPLVSQIFPRGVIPAEVETSVYQSIVAIWPTSSPWDEELTERVVSCCIKAAREAKLRTSWSDPDKSFERAVQEFVPNVVDSSGSYDLLESFVQEIAAAGAVNSLALVVMKTVAPGVPDFYQGTETWRYLLVDPDNRQPVDFQKLQRGLSTLQESRVLSATRRFEEDWPDGSLKMFLIRESLRTRREFSQLFADGAYLSLQAHGGHGDNIISFARCLDDAVALCIVPRLTVGISGPNRFPLGDRWGETGLFIPPDCGTRFRDAFTGNVVEVTGSSIRIADVLTALPVALLLRA
jgi:(1->4)-alpha-D-glucan 1-alpha-D-glucosylmutase